MLKQNTLKRIPENKDYKLIIEDIHKLLLQGKKSSSLLKGVCTKIYKIGDYRFVWIGLLNGIHNTSRLVDPISSYYPETLGKNYTDDIIHESIKPEGPLSWPIKSKKHRIFRHDQIKDEFSKEFNDVLDKGGINCFIVIPLKYNNKIVGTMNIFSGNDASFREDEIGVLLEVAKNISTDTRGMKLEVELKNTLKQLQRALYETIDAITLMSEIKDPYTSGHQKKVALLASAISEELGLPRDMIDGIYISGLLHDVGKISVPNDILAKPGKLNEGEFIIVKNHPIISYDILKSIEFPWPVADIVSQHHEKINGSGYPGGIYGDDIRIEAKILVVADVVEAMTAHRPYRPALGLKKAISEITKNKNILYDKKIVEACIRAIENRKIKL